MNHSALQSADWQAESDGSMNRKWARQSAKAQVPYYDSARKELLRIIETNPDGILIADQQQIVRFVNPAAEVMFGRMAPVVGHAVAFPLMPLIDGTRRDVEIYGLHGEAGTAEIRVVEIEWDGAAAHLGTLRDITARKQEYESALELAKRASIEADQRGRTKDEFLVMLSHELRTPMTAIVGWMTMIRSGRLELDQVQRGLDVIHRNVQTELRLICDMLDLSAIATGKLQIVNKPLDLCLLLTSIADAQRVVADAHCLKLKLKLDCATLSFVGDRDRLHQVIANLITNSIKFTPEGGEVTLSLRRVAADAEISVSDNGAGIRADFLPHVFERFKQSDGAHARISGGMGLGLAIAKHIIELHGGTITASSAGEGRGATFTVRLPLAS
jgi:signal transduction histidine kinase